MLFPYYAPYIKEDLPDNIYVNGESKIQEFKITLHNPDNLYDNTDDYTWTKHYSAQLYIKNGDDVILYNEAIGNPNIGMEPYKSLGLIYKDKIYKKYLDLHNLSLIQKDKDIFQDFVL